MSTFANVERLTSFCPIHPKLQSVPCLFTRRFREWPTQNDYLWEASPCPKGFDASESSLTSSSLLDRALLGDFADPACSTTYAPELPVQTTRAALRSLSTISLSGLSNRGAGHHCDVQPTSRLQTAAAYRIPIHWYKFSIHCPPDPQHVQSSGPYIDNDGLRAAAASRTRHSDNCQLVMFSDSHCRSQRTK